MSGAIVIELGERWRAEGFWECCCGCTGCVMSGPHAEDHKEGARPAQYNPPTWTEPGAPDWPWPERKAS